MKKIIGIIPIFIYFLFLVVMNVWWMHYYMSPEALDFGFLFYFPYCLGGSFIICFLLGILVRKICCDGRIHFMLLYMFMILFSAYFVIWLNQALQKSFPNFQTFYKQDVPWLYGFTQVDTPIILLESAVGFLIGWIWQNQRGKKKKRQQ